jgi:PAS domain-containing protein
MRIRLHIRCRATGELRAFAVSGNFSPRFFLANRLFSRQAGRPLKKSQLAADKPTVGTAPNLSMAHSELERSPCEASKIELELVLNAIDEGFCGLDTAGNVTFCNDAFLRMSGYQAEEIIGENLQELLRRGRAEGPKNGTKALDLGNPVNAQLPDASRTL